jgi:hypothetical protein
MTVALVIGAVVLVAMVGVSYYGWVTLPADARVPVHFGPAAYNNFVPKRLGLVLHPAVGALVYVILVVTQHVQEERRAPVRPLDFILPLVMCLLLVVQAGAIRVARTRAGTPEQLRT